MSTKRDFIADITAAKESWTIVARIVRLWFLADFDKTKLPYSMELVLMDEKGDRIQASVRRTLIYKFEKGLKEGLVYSISFFTVGENNRSFKATRHQYKLNFQFRTKVSLVENISISPSLYNFVNVVDVLDKDFETDYLVDVIGLLAVVGDEREYEKGGEKSKMNVIQLDCEGAKIDCALFGTYVDELNSFLDSGGSINAVVIVQMAKVKQFQGQNVLQNSMNTTKIIFNPQCSFAVEFKKRMSESSASPSQGLSQLSETSRITVEDDFLLITPRKTIEELRDSKEDCCCIVMATVKHVLNAEDWWYTACSCNKKVYPDSNMFFCEKCNKHVPNVVPRFRIKVRVIDNSDSATFVLFDRDASFLMNQSCAEMIDAVNKKSAPFNVPDEITALIDKTFLFKVECQNVVSSKFEQSFRVKRVCNDPAIVKSFMEKFQFSVNVPNEEDDCFNAESCGGVIQDLMPMFSEAVLDKRDSCKGRGGIDLTDECDDFTPAKRVCTEQCHDAFDSASASIKCLKKDIKIEKD